MELFNTSGGVDNSVFEQYKLCVEMADRISQRRMISNSFYLTILSIIISLFSFVEISAIFFQVLFCIVGVLFSLIWYVNISIYKKMNSIKFKIINELEERLPAFAFAKEYAIQNSTKHTKFTSIEKFAPIFFALIFVTIGLFFVSCKFCCYVK